MHPRPKAQRRGKARAAPTLEGKGGGVMYKSCSWPTNPGRGGEGGQAYKGRREMGGEGWGKPAWKLPASFRLTTSCTFLLVPPRGLSSQQTIFVSSQQPTAPWHSPFYKASCKRPGQVSSFITG